VTDEVMRVALRCGLLCGLGLLLAFGRPAAGAGLVVDRYAAAVNQRVITTLDVLTQLQPIRQQLMETYSGEALEKKLMDAYQRALNALIERALILEEFKQISEKDGLKIPEQLVDSRAYEVIHERFNNNRSAFLEALSAEHLTMDEWRSDTKDYLILSILRRREIMDRVVVMPRDVRALYARRADKYREPEKLQLRVLVLHRGVTDAEQAAKRQAAEQLRAEALAGGDFAALVKKHSEGFHAAEGGEWGWLKPGDLRPELAAAVTNVPIGQFSLVLPAGDELYLIQVEAHQPARIRPLAEVYAELSAELHQAEGERLYKEWINRLRQKYYVKIYPAD